MDAVRVSQEPQTHRSKWAGRAYTWEVRVEKRTRERNRWSHQEAQHEHRVGPDNDGQQASVQPDVARLKLIGSR